MSARSRGCTELQESDADSYMHQNASEEKRNVPNLINISDVRRSFETQQNFNAHWSAEEHYWGCERRDFSTLAFTPQSDAETVSITLRWQNEPSSADIFRCVGVVIYLSHRAQLLHGFIGNCWKRDPMSLISAIYHICTLKCQEIPCEVNGEWNLNCISKRPIILLGNIRPCWLQ